MKPFIIVILMLNSVAMIAQQKTISRKELLKTAIDQNVKSAEIQEITMVAGLTAPKHVHPCPVVGII